jgi:hypothetical protein
MPLGLIEALAALITTPAVDANSALLSSTSTHAPNDNEVRLNYILWFSFFFLTTI